MNWQYLADGILHLVFQYTNASLWPCFNFWGKTQVQSCRLVDNGAWLTSWVSFPCAKAIYMYIPICHRWASKLLNFPHQLSSTDQGRCFVLISSVRIQTYGMFHSSCDKLADTNELLNSLHLFHLVFINSSFLAVTKQFYEWFSLSISPSHLFHYVPIIISSWNFLVLTIEKSDVHVKGQGQRSKAQYSYFRIVTPVWIVFQGHLSNFKVTLNKIIANFDPNLAFPDCISSLNWLIAMNWCTKLEVA